MTRATRNILFIMCDQLRWDYLSCSGHPRLSTPNIDALAATFAAKVRELGHLHPVERLARIA